MRGSRSVRSLLEQVEQMPPGFARTAVAEEAVREADAAGDLDAAFETRVRLASVATHGGEPQKAMVAITWCLGQIDSHPGRFDIHPTFWALKWLPGQLRRMPEVPLREIEDVLAEVRRRYDSVGTGQDALAKLDMVHALRTGRVADAVEAHRRWRLEPRSDLGDCRACDVAAEVDLALALEDPTRALEVARPLLAGRLECAEEPAGTLAMLLEPLAELGRADEAERLHVWGLRLSRGNPSLVGDQAEHGQHLVRTGRIEEATRLLGELVEVCDRGLFDAQARMLVAAFGGSVAGTVHDAGVDEAPPAFGTRPREWRLLSEAFAGEARTVAAAFDRRNGTDYVARDVERRLAVRPQHTMRVPAPSAPPAPAPDGQPLIVVDLPEPVGGDGPEVLLERARTGTNLDVEARLRLAERARDGFDAVGDPAGVARAHRTVGAALAAMERFDDAEQVLREALDRLVDDPHEYALGALALARVLFDRAGRADDEVRTWAETAMSAAARSPEAARDRARCQAQLAEWRVRELGPDPDPAALAEARRAFDDVRGAEAADPEAVVRLWLDQAVAHGVAGQSDAVLTAAEAAWRLVADEPDHAVRADAADVYGRALADVGESDRALELLATAQRLHSARGDLVLAAESAATRVEVLVGVDRMEAALGQAWDAVDLQIAAGHRPVAAWMRLTIAQVLRALGRDLDAHDVLVELVERAAEDGDRPLESAVAYELAQMDAEYGDLDQATEHVRRAVRNVAPDDEVMRGRVHRLLARVHDARGESAEAIAAGVVAVHALADADPHGCAAVRQDQADRLTLSGRADEALALYADARQVFEAHDDDVAVASVDLGRADALAASGRAEEAVALARQVVEAGRRVDVPPLVADALWAVASHSPPQQALYDDAIAAYEAAGAPEEQLDFLRQRRDKAVKRSRWRR